MIQGNSMRFFQVNVFPGMANIPIIAARETGLFRREGLEVVMTGTPSSLAQRAALMDGTADIAHAAFDDVVAGDEDAGTDFVAVLGGDGGFQSLYARGDIRSAADLRGRVVAVDDPRTAYALVLRAALRRAGLTEADYEMRPVGSTARRYEALRADANLAACMLAPPFSVQAEAIGWHSLGSAGELLGAYQGTVAFCRRAWLAGNRAVLVRYLRAYLAGLDWALDPGHREQLASWVAAALKVPPAIARLSCDQAIDAGGGLVPGATLDDAGLRTVLDLRAGILGWRDGKAPPAGRYIDLSAAEEARSTM